MAATSDAMLTLFALAALLTSASADPVLNCTKNEFIADSNDLCVYYLCVDGEFHPSGAMQCAKGTRLPTWYNSSYANPCTKTNTGIDCLRCNFNDIRDKPDETVSECKLWQPCDPGCVCHDVVDGYWCDCQATLVTLPQALTAAYQCVKYPSYCKNGAGCYQLVDEKPFCDCPPGWTGKQCETKICDWNPCKNNGTCVLNGTVIQCICDQCHRGSCCEDLIVEDPDCIHCLPCVGGLNCTGGRPWLCTCNPCPNDTICVPAALNKVRLCRDSAPTASDKFTLMFEENYGNESYSALELYITPGDDHPNDIRQVQVSAPASINCPFNVRINLTPGDVRKVPVPLCLRHNGTGLGRHGILVKEINNRTVTVYGINRSLYSADSFLALPDEFAGNHFVVISYQSYAHPSPPQNDRQSQIGIVATKDNTRVNVTLAAPIQINQIWIKNDTTLSFKLDAYQTFQIQSNISHDDLTGSIITSSEFIHVVSGNVRTAVLDRNVSYNDYRLSSDHLIEEIPPATRWGTAFAIVPVPRRSLGYNITRELIRVVATFDAICTLYNSTGESTFVILTVRDWFIEFFVNADDNHFLNCTKPVLIMQITLSADETLAATFNDPALIFVPTIQQYTNYYSFVPPVFSYTGKPYTYTLAIFAAREGEYDAIEINNVRTAFLQPFKNWAKIARSDSVTADHKALYGGIFPLPNAITSSIRIRDKAKSFMCLIYAYDDRESIGHVAGALLSDTNAPSYDTGSQWLWAQERNVTFLN